MQEDLNLTRIQFKLKDLSLIGKLHSVRSSNIDNPEINKHPSKSIGTNTHINISRLQNNLSPIKGPWPVTHQKNVTFKSRNQSPKIYKNCFQPQSTQTSFNKSQIPNNSIIMVECKQLLDSYQSQNNSPINKSQLIGHILKQSPPKRQQPLQPSFVVPKYLTTPQLPYMSKINNNEKVFKDFVVNTSPISGNIKKNIPRSKNNNYMLTTYRSNYSNNYDLEKNNYMLNNSYLNISTNLITFQGNKQDSSILYNSNVTQKDPNYQHTLIKNSKVRQNCYLPAVNYSVELNPQRLSRLNKIKEESPQLQSSQILPSKNSITKSSRKIIYQYQQQQNNNYSNHEDINPQIPGFIYNRILSNPINCVMIGLGTSASTLKQLLIQSQKYFQVSFRIPQIFLQPLLSTVTQQQLHKTMIEVYSFLGVKPQIVSIKKYVNCVMMKQKDLCILWHYQGRVYFGGWKDKQNGEVGCKSGLGLQWMPSKYIYYGQFESNNKHGYGIMKRSSKQVYIGLWEKNQKSGWGKTYNTEGQLIENGEYLNGKLTRQIQSGIRIM